MEREEYELLDELDVEEDSSPVTRSSNWDLLGESFTEQIREHVEEHIGAVDRVMHEVVGDNIHLDLFVVPQGRGRDYLTVVTSGLSDKPMSVPKGQEGLRYAELLMRLPPSWPLFRESVKDGRHGWPIDCLKVLARLVGEDDLSLSCGEVVPNGDPPLPYHDSTQLCGVFLTNPRLEHGGLGHKAVGGQSVVNFYEVVPIYVEELLYRQRRGAEALKQRLLGDGRVHVVQPDRDNAAPVRRPFFF